TQFALLALWVARRHQIPSEHAALHALRRFATTQNPDGGWGYATGQNSTPTMTGVGLLGLAMGHSTFAELTNQKGDKGLQDPSIQNGLRVLGNQVGTAGPGADARGPLASLYFLWTV